MNITLRPFGYFRALLQSPEQLEMTVQDYLGLNKTPTLAGLCAYLGATVAELYRIFSAKTDAIYCPEETKHVISSAVTIIEASLVEKGLLEVTNPHFTKFLMSAYHNRNEKTVAESHTTGRLIVEFRDDSEQNKIVGYEVKQLENRMNEHIQTTKRLVGEKDVTVAVKTRPQVFLEEDLLSI